MRKRALCLMAIAVTAATAENWPGWRGPSRQGISNEAGIPVEFGPGKNLAWKTPIAGEGWSSPIVWNDRVFVTTATEEGSSCRLLALNRDTGKVLWDVELAKQQTGRKEAKNSYASPTPATDGKRVYAVCGDGTFAAVDFASGKTVWVNRDYPHYSQHGLGASPVLEAGLVMMPRDGSSESGDLKLGWQKPWERSFVVALDAATGKERWKTGRGMSRIAHVSPNVTGSTLVSGAGDVVQGFDVKTGKLLWTGRSQGEGVVPSVVLGDGMAFTCSGFEKPTIRAYRLGGAGDVTGTHLVWEQTRGVPMIPSLLYASPLLYSVTTNGVAYAYRGSTGEVVWQARLSGNYSASPVLAGGKLYFASEEGEVVVVKAGPEFQVMARNELGEKMQASPAVSQGRLFVRTAGHLWCFRGER